LLPVDAADQRSITGGAVLGVNNWDYRDKRYPTGNALDKPL
jgi:hypothetical protein